MGKETHASMVQRSSGEGGGEETHAHARCKDLGGGRETRACVVQRSSGEKETHAHAWCKDLVRTGASC